MAESRTIEISVKVESAKYFGAVAIFDCICLQCETNVLKLGHKCRVFVRYPLDINEIFQRGYENETKSPKVITFRIDATKDIEISRKGTRLIEVTEMVSIVDEQIFLGHRLEDYGENGDEDILEDEIETHYEHEEEVGEANEESDGNLRAKTMRHEMFIEWLIDVYGKDFLSKGSGVLDVAGGKGRLCQCLLKVGIPCILIEPQNTIDQDEFIERVTNKTADKHEFVHIKDFLNGDGSNLIAMSENEIGMHPDEATEPIIDLAIRLHVPFAVIPCCVFPFKFPNRILKQSKQPVRSYRTFCQFLIEKAPEHCYYLKTTLPFIGKNVIVFKPPENESKKYLLPEPIIHRTKAQQKKHRKYLAKQHKLALAAAYDDGGIIVSDQ